MAVRAFLVIVFYHPLIYVIQFSSVSARHVDLCSLVCVGVSLVDVSFLQAAVFFIPPATDLWFSFLCSFPHYVLQIHSTV